MGIHVAVEGLDGSGKTTLVTELSKILGGRTKVISTGLPDVESYGGEILQEILRRRRPAPSPAVLALAFAANRLDHFRKEVQPILDAPGPAVVISHRHLLSGLAYQGAQGIDYDWLDCINRDVEPPDLTLYLDTPPELCAARLTQRESQPELFETDLLRSSVAFQEAIRDVARRGWNVEVLNGALPAHELADYAAQLVIGALKSR